MTKEELNNDVQKIYTDYDAGDIDSGDALVKVVNLVEKFSKENKIPDGPEYGVFLIDELNNALNQFGTYTYQDKGPHEVMYINKYVNDLKSLNMKEIAEILTYILDNHDLGEELVSAIIGDMDDREDFEELFEYDDRFEY